MKKNIFITLCFVVFLSSNAYCLDSRLLDARNTIFEQAKEIRLLLPKSQDAILLVSMWDSCLIAVMQLDAYFSMVGLFNAIKRENTTEDTINYVVSWLGEMKSTNELNVKNLNLAVQIIDNNTRVQIEKLKAYFTDLNSRIEIKYNKFFILKGALRLKGK